MRYFIVKKRAEYVIFKVKMEDEEMFREKYASEILVEASSLVELLLRFEQEILFSLDYIQPGTIYSHPKGT